MSNALKTAVCSFQGITYIFSHNFYMLLTIEKDCFKDNGFKDTISMKILHLITMCGFIYSLVLNHHRFAYFVCTISRLAWAYSSTTTSK